MSWGSSASVSSTPFGAYCRVLRGASVRSGHGHLAQNLRHHTSSTIAPSRARRTAAPVSSRGMSSLPARIRLVIFDLDGVIYRGLEPIDGARELVAALHAAGVAVRFATNNSMVAREGYVIRLERHGDRHDGRGDRDVHVGNGRASAPARAGRALRARHRRERDGGRAARRGAVGRHGRRRVDCAAMREAR